MYKGIILDKTVLSFPAGVQRAGFTVIYNESVNPTGIIVERGRIALVLGGINKEVYKLDSQVVTFNIVAQDTQVPRWLDIHIDTIRKT